MGVTWGPQERLSALLPRFTAEVGAGPPEYAFLSPRTETRGEKLVSKVSVTFVNT